jgi:hypothetical protein
MAMIVWVLISIDSKSRVLPGRRIKQFPKANTLISSLTSISHPQAVLATGHRGHVHCLMSDYTSVGGSLLTPSQRYMAKAANLGPDEVEYVGVTMYWHHTFKSMVLFLITVLMVALLVPTAESSR